VLFPNFPPYKVYAISRQYIIPVLLPAAGTLSMSIIVLKNIFFTGEGAGHRWQLLHVSVSHDVYVCVSVSHDLYVSVCLCHVTCMCLYVCVI